MDAPESTSKTIPSYLIVIACLFFLVVSGAVWFNLETTTTTVIYYVVFMIPNLLAAEYLAEKMLNIFRKKT